MQSVGLQPLGKGKAQKGGNVAEIQQDVRTTCYVSLTSWEVSPFVRTFQTSNDQKTVFTFFFLQLITGSVLENFRNRAMYLGFCKASSSESEFQRFQHEGECKFLVGVFQPNKQQLVPQDHLLPVVYQISSAQEISSPPELFPYLLLEIPTYHLTYTIWEIFAMQIDAFWKTGSHVLCLFVI